MSTCGEAGPDVHALIEELLVVIRRVKSRSGTHSDGSPYLAEGTEVARLRGRFSFVLKKTLSLGTRHRLCRLGVTLAGSQQLRPQGPMSVQTHCNEGGTASEGRQRANADGSGFGERKEDGNGIVDGDGDGIGDGNGNEGSDGSGNRHGSGNGNGDEKEEGGSEGRELRHPPHHDRSIEDVDEGMTPMTTNNLGRDISRPSNHVAPSGGSDPRGEKGISRVGSGRDWYDAQNPAKEL